MSSAGRDAIFILAGTELPKEFSYRVSRKEDGKKSWEVIGMLTFPSNPATLRGKLMTSIVQSENAIVPEERVVHRIWNALNKGRTIDSLYTFVSNPAWLSATGNGMWDKSVKPNVLYSYRIHRLDENGTVLLEEMIPPVKFPGASPLFTIKAANFRTGDNSLTANFVLQSSEIPAGCKVYRSDYLRQNFKEVGAMVSFYQNARETMIRVEDATAQKKMLYSYYLTPYDTWGNPGLHSDTLHVYNADGRDIDSKIVRFHTHALVDENAIRIAWKVDNHADIISVDLYKGVQYDQQYVRIGSFSASDSTYIDRDVKPIATYFYTIVLNTAFGRSFPSGRISGMLPASRKNLFPPMNVSAERQDEIVRLTWSKTEPDTRGYYVYRADSYTGKMQQVSSLILSDDSVVHFIDSVKKMHPSPVWVYAIADVNTSYVVGPLSEKVSVPGKNTFMPTPTDVTVRLEGGVIHVLWRGISDEYSGVSGYWIYRRVEDANGKEIEPKRKVIADPLGMISSYRDASITEGLRYFYSIQAIGLHPSEVSAESMETGCFVPEQLPLPPANTRVFNVDKGIHLQWDKPFDETITGIRIYRTTQGNDWKLVKSLESTAEDFIDNAVKKNTTYFFRVTTVNAKGRESKADVPIGVRVGD